MQPKVLSFALGGVAIMMNLPIQSLLPIFVLLLTFVAITLGVILLRQMLYRGRLIDFQLQISLPCSPPQVYAELADLSKWSRWSSDIESGCSISNGAGLGQVLYGTEVSPFNSLEIIQAWPSRRLQLVMQSFAQSCTCWEQIDILWDGAHCCLKWHSHIEFWGPRNGRRSQRKSFVRARQSFLNKLASGLNHCQL